MNKSSESYIPKWTEDDFCSGMNLCSVRKSESWETKIWMKDLSWDIKEGLLKDIINLDEYKGKKIVRVYSSGHWFLNEDRTKVYLVTTEKNWKRQIQFTWWSPLEEENKDVIKKVDWVYMFDIHKMIRNARIRAENRVWVKVISEYNGKPIVDWVLMENIDENTWEIFYKLVCLTHFVVKQYTWELKATGKEHVIEGNWYNIADLPSVPNVAPNVSVVLKSAIKEIFDN